VIVLTEEQIGSILASQARLERRNAETADKIRIVLEQLEHQQAETIAQREDHLRRTEVLEQKQCVDDAERMERAASQKTSNRWIRFVGLALSIMLIPAAGYGGNAAIADYIVVRERAASATTSLAALRATEHARAEYAHETRARLRAVEVEQAVIESSLAGIAHSTDLILDKLEHRHR